MKKILAVLIAVMLVAAMAVNVFAAEATVTTTFVCTFTDNDYDSAITGGSLSGDNINIDGTWGGSFPDITPLIETVAPLADVTHVSVTVKASNTDPCWNGASQKLEMHWNTRDNTDGMPATVDFVDGVAVVESDVPSGISAIVLNPYAFSSEAGEISFEVTVVVTGNFEAPAAEEDGAEVAPEAEEEAPVAEPEAEAEAPAAETEAPAAEAETTAAPAPATGIALAVVPAVMALAALCVSKKK